MSLNLVPPTPLSMVELISAWLSGPVEATSVSRAFRSASVLVGEVCQVNSVAVVAMMRAVQVKRRGGGGDRGKTRQRRGERVGKGTAADADPFGGAAG